MSDRLEDLKTELAQPRSGLAVTLAGLLGALVLLRREHIRPHVRDDIFAQLETMAKEGAAFLEKDEAADRIKALEARLADRRMCVNCGRYAPAGHDRSQPLPECVGPEGLSACTFDLTPDEAWQHWRKIAHDQRARIEALEAIAMDLQTLCDKQAFRIAALEAEKEQLEKDNKMMRRLLSPPAPTLRR